MPFAHCYNRLRLKAYCSSEGQRFPEVYVQLREVYMPRNSLFMHEIEFMYVEHGSNRRNLFFCKSHMLTNDIVVTNGLFGTKENLVSDGKLDRTT
jgi:hypothetical protein